MYGLDDDEEHIALTILKEMQTIVQRIMRGRSVCIIDPLTFESALVSGMLWPGLGIVPSHARPGDVVIYHQGLLLPEVASSTQRPGELFFARGHEDTQSSVC